MDTQTTTYEMARTVDRPYDETVAAVREALADHGFGVPTEIDVRATLKTKLGVDVAPQIILGACRPQLAHQALQAEPSLGVLLPCNVVVRTVDAATTIVEAVDLQTMVALTGNEHLRRVADEAATRLHAALGAVA